MREAGRGFVLITGAKLWFLLTATFTSLAFPRLFDNDVLYGQFRIVSGLLNVVTMVVITASVQAVSKLASEAGADLRQVRRAALIGQLAFFGPVALLFCGFSGVIAARVLNDPGISTPLLVSSLVVVAYMIYSVMIGLLNGTRNFGRQAGLDILFSTMKTALMIAAVVATGSVVLSYGAFAATAWIVLLVALVLAGRVVAKAPGGAVQKGITARYFSYLLPLAAYALVLNLLLQADVIWLKAVVGRGSVAGTSASVADHASLVAGIYGFAKNVALLPYQAVISLTFIVFPLVSTACSSGDRKGASNVVSGAFRLAAILSWGAVVLFGAAPAEILRLLKNGFEAGAPGLVVMLAAGAFLAFMYVGNAVIASSGQPVISVLGGLGAVVAQLGMLAVAPRFVPVDRLPLAAAFATLAGAFCGATVSAVLTIRMYRSYRWIWTFVSAVGSAAAGLLVAFLLDGHVAWVFKPVAAVAVFLFVLVLTRGVGRADLEVVMSVMRRRRKS